MSDALSDQQLDELAKLLGAPILFPQEFKTWLSDWVGTNIPLIPYSQLFGAQLNLARSGQSIASSESTGSATYTDLGTIGPQVTGLIDGTYLVFFGAHMSGQGAYMAISINGSTPGDTQALHESEIDCDAGRAIFVTAKNNNDNTIKVVYRKEGGAAATFANRWMTVLRIGAG